jgi:hypothetical protein
MIRIKNAKSVAARRTPIRRALFRPAVALLALAALAAPASAKPFQQLQSGVCVGKTCTITFSKVPVGQRLEVNNASCYVRMATQAGPLGLVIYPPVVAAQLAVLGADPTKIVNAVTLVTNITGEHDDQVVLSSNDAVSAFANPQQRFQALVTLYEGQVFELHCSISGDMVNAT